jgi:hypothetical protein
MMQALHAYNTYMPEVIGGIPVGAPGAGDTSI